jgi:hypothetical protein
MSFLSFGFAVMFDTLMRQYILPDGTVLTGHYALVDTMKDLIGRPGPYPVEPSVRACSGEFTATENIVSRFSDTIHKYRGLLYNHVRGPKNSDGIFLAYLVCFSFQGRQPGGN